MALRAAVPSLRTHELFFTQKKVIGRASLTPPISPLRRVTGCHVLCYPAEGVVYKGKRARDPFSPASSHGIKSQTSPSGEASLNVIIHFFFRFTRVRSEQSLNVFKGGSIKGKGAPMGTLLPLPPAAAISLHERPFTLGKKPEVCMYSSFQKYLKSIVGKVAY